MYPMKRSGLGSEHNTQLLSISEDFRHVGQAECLLNTAIGARRTMCNVQA